MAVYTERENRHFVEAIMKGDVMDNAVYYITENVTPTDLYSKEALAKSISESFYPHDIFEKQELIDWASGEDLEEIFSKDQLKEWARGEGIESIFTTKEIIEVAGLQKPDDVFSADELRQWALDNDFIFPH